MQKKHLILPFILTLFSLLSAGGPDTLWTRTYGGTDNDYGRSVLQTNDGGFIIAGYTSSFGSGGFDVYLIKTNSEGDTIWTKTFGGTNNDYGYSIQQTSDSGYIITGSTNSLNDTLYDVYLIRTNSNGDTLWTKTYGGIGNDDSWSVQQASDSGFIITGRTNSFEDIMGDVYLIRTNNNGDTLWTKTYGGDSSDWGYSVLQTNDSGFVVVGGTESFGAGRCDVYLIQTDLNGDTLWTKTYGGENFDFGKSIQQASDNGFIITGSTNSFGLGKNDVYQIRLNSNGDTLCTRTYGGIGMDEGSSVFYTNDDRFITVGAIESPGLVNYDIYLIFLNSNGDSLWTKFYGGDSIDYGHSILQTNDGGFIIAGETKSFGSGKSDVYLIRLDKDTTAIQQEIPSNLINPNNFIVSNNHGNISIRYTIPYSSSVKIEAYDTQGKLVKVIQDKFTQMGSYSMRWESKRFGSGVYFIKLSANGSSVSKKFTILK